MRPKKPSEPVPTEVKAPSPPTPSPPSPVKEEPPVKTETVVKQGKSTDIITTFERPHQVIVPASCLSGINFYLVSGPTSSISEAGSEDSLSPNCREMSFFLNNMM